MLESIESSLAIGVNEACQCLNVPLAGCGVQSPTIALLGSLG